MSFISVFDVLGPNMIGPSSSHTAGACAIALLAQQMKSGTLKEVEFTLYGSFAKTYHGHGTDRALLGGSWDLPQMMCGSGIPLISRESGASHTAFSPTKRRQMFTPTPWISGWSMRKEPK